MKYLAGYSSDLQDSARKMLENETLGTYLLKRYGKQSHSMKSDRALTEFVFNIKRRYMKNAPVISKVSFNSKISPVNALLGVHTFQSKAHGRKTKATSTIQIASLFKDVPLEFLRMICVHELAHVKEKNHDKPFYKLCTYLEPDYFQLEFDCRLYLTWLDKHGPLFD